MARLRDRLASVTPIQWVLFAAGLLGITILVTVPSLGQDTTVWGQVLITLGEASVVTGALGLTVEPLARKASLEAVVGDAASYILTHDLPQQVADEIDYLSDFDFIRHDVELLMRFQQCDEPDSVLVLGEIEYEVVNYTAGDEPYPFRVHLTGRSADEGALNLVSVRGEDIDEPLRIEEGEFEDHTEEQEMFMIPPNVGRARNTFTIRTVERLPADFEDVHFMREPVLGARVRIENETDRDLDIDVRFGTRRQEHVHPHPPDSPTEWTLRDTLLVPWQAITIEWSLSQDEVR